jgi:ubiquinone/menaquinone biosynthesis C-methylase UbiE
MGACPAGKAGAQKIMFKPGSALYSRLPIILSRNTLLSDHESWEQRHMSQFEGFAELEREGWTSAKGASGYVELFASASDMAIPAILEKLEPSTHVLDLCCGQGNVTKALVNAAHTVIGADFSPAMIAMAEERNPGRRFVEADAQDLPFEEGQFDAVVCNFGIGHIPDQLKALSEAARVVKTGGTFVMTGWSGPAVSPAFRIFYSSVQEHGDPSVTMPEAPNFHQFDDKEFASEIFSKAGMELVSHEQVDCSWQMEDPAMLFDIYEKGAPRGGTLLRKQPPEAREAIRQAVAEKVAKLEKVGNEYRVGVPATLLCGRSV